MPKFEIADAFWESDLWEFFVEWAVNERVSNKIQPDRTRVVFPCECTLGASTSKPKYSREQIAKMSYSPHVYEKDFYEWKFNIWEKSPPI